MNCIELMVDEHKNIKRMLEVIRKYCYRMLKGEQVEYGDLYKIIDFVRNYADKHHHGKEETMLFNKMMDELGPTAEKLVRLGMNVEHDLGRLHMSELEAAIKRVSDGDDESRLDVIANAVSYTHLLHRHIEKEDNVVYQYAQRSLAQASLDRLDEECKKFEEDAAVIENKLRHLSILEEMEAKYR